MIPTVPIIAPAGVSRSTLLRAWSQIAAVRRFDSRRTDLGLSRDAFDSKCFPALPKFAML